MENTFGINIIPDNDQQRLAVLNRYQILDTPSEESFDNIAKLATEFFDVPISLVSLVDEERVFFKANVGMGRTKSSSRGVSLCALGILNSDITVFEDALKAPCLLSNPLVVGDFGLKFYAGAPLITHDGFNIGTICIVDKKTRPFSKKDELLLRRLAKIAMDAIELRISAIDEFDKQQIVNAKLIESEAKANFLIADAPIAIGILSGRELKIDSANDKILQIWGKTEAILGKTLKEALPELLEVSQPFLQILDDVFTSGKAFFGTELKAELFRSQQLEEVYLNFVYHPVKNAEGKTESIMIVATDVTDQVLARKKIELAEKRMENMVLHSNIGMSIFRGRDLIIEIANAPMYEIWGKTPEQALDKPLLEVFPELEGQAFPEMLDNIFTTGLPVENPEIAVKLQSGEGTKDFFIDVTYVPLFDVDGNVELIVATVVDITEIVLSRKLLEESREEQHAVNEMLKEANEELAVTNEEIQASNEELLMSYENLKLISEKLAESESRFRSMIDQSPVAMMVTRGKDLVVDEVNPIMLQILGNRYSILGKPLFDTFPELDAQGFKEMIFEVYETGKPFYSLDTPVTLLINGKEELKYFNLAYTPIRENGQIDAVLQVAIEVTDQIADREKLRNAEEMLRFAIDAANVGTWHIDLQTMKGQTSPSLRKLYGYHMEEEMPFPNHMDQIAKEYRKRVTDALEDTIKNGRPFNVEYPVTGLRDGQLRWLRATGKVGQNINKTGSYFSGVAIEITEQKQDELRKNDFIAMVSHELKTPLTTLNAYMQILVSKNKGNTDNFTRTALEKGNLQIKKMTTMIDGFLNLSQMEAGKITLRKSKFLISDLIHEVVGDFKLVTETHPIIISSISESQVDADRDKIGQVITNFLSNAIKYSGSGSPIQVNCEVAGQDVQISVKDEGNGISPEDCKKLFERFYRVENANHKNIVGFGIGLYICAEIIERHEGTISVESEKGKGSTFKFNLRIVG